MVGCEGFACSEANDMSNTLALWMRRLVGELVHVRKESSYNRRLALSLGSPIFLSNPPSYDELLEQFYLIRVIS